jgi:hypothetical protein
LAWLWAARCCVENPVTRKNVTIAVVCSGEPRKCLEKITERSPCKQVVELPKLRVVLRTKNTLNAAVKEAVLTYVGRHPFLKLDWATESLYATKSVVRKPIRGGEVLLGAEITVLKQGALDAIHSGVRESRWARSAWVNFLPGHLAHTTVVCCLAFIVVAAIGGTVRRWRTV